MNNTLKAIKNEKDYEEALIRIENLLDINPNQEQINQLEVLTILVKDYETKHYSFDLPDPIEAIKFRMEQECLTRKDLVKYIGSQSKVSEVLNHKKPLSLNMIRALHEGLGIPAEVLLQKAGEKLKPCKYNLYEYPFNEMYRRNFFVNAPAKLNLAKENAEEILNIFFQNFPDFETQMACRQSSNGLLATNTLKAWQMQVINIIKTEKKLPKFDIKSLDKKFIKRLTRLSYFAAGPSLVKESLNKIGIHFIILKHLPKTHLDGACFFVDENPVIAMTIRHDRLDNFWFTLMHELGHIIQGHISENSHKAFLDNTYDADQEKDTQEAQADKFALDSFIKQDIWAKNAKNLTDETSIKYLAEDLEISPAIIAGRLRWEFGDYKIHNHLVGLHEVKKYFELTGELN